MSLSLLDRPCLRIIKCLKSHKSLRALCSSVFICPLTALLVPLSLTHWLTDSVTDRHFWKHYQRTLCETCDPWDMSLEWWGDMTWPISDFRKSFRFSENFQNFGKWSDFKKRFRFSENDGDSICNSCDVSKVSRRSVQGNFNSCLRTAKNIQLNQSSWLQRSTSTASEHSWFFPTLLGPDGLIAF